MIILLLLIPLSLLLLVAAIWAFVWEKRKTPWCTPWPKPTPPTNTIGWPC